MTTAHAPAIPLPALRPIQFVTDVLAWRRFWTDLGLVVAGDEDPEWTVLAAGSGRLALHRVEPAHPLAGAVTVVLEVRGLDAYGKPAATAGADVRPVRLDHGDAPAARLPHGVVHVDEIDPATGEGGLEPVSADLLAVVALVRGPAVREGGRCRREPGAPPAHHRRRRRLGRPHRPRRPRLPRRRDAYRPRRGGAVRAQPRDRRRRGAALAAR